MANADEKASSADDTNRDGSLGDERDGPPDPAESERREPPSAEEDEQDDYANASEHTS